MPGKSVQSVRGVRDLLPEDAAVWRSAERIVIETLEEHGYREFRVPLLEHAELYLRSVGEDTDIVQKEMYTTQGSKGRTISLRPEATAGIVRAALEHGLHRGRHRIWCAGPMFRRERPQRGRLRQFHQFDVEAIGFAGPDIDAELIALSARVFDRLGVDGITLELNSLGGSRCRAAYRDRLREYFGDHMQSLDADSRARLDRNPLRILDSRNPEMAALIGAAPEVSEFLEPESADHFAGLQTLLTAIGLNFRVNSRLVRGLDYYSRTVFEFLTDRLGAQNAVCAGGRYDGLVEQLGGPPTPAIGWAMGIERVLELARLPESAEAEGAYLVLLGGNDVREAGLKLAETLRNECPGLPVQMHCGGGGARAQMRQASRSGARYALVVGERELGAGTVGLKDLREEGEQKDVPIEELSRVLRGRSDRTIRDHG